MSYAEMVKDLVPAPTPEIDSACRELEQRGLVFCVHFGLLNAVAICCEMVEAEEYGYLDDWLKEHGVDVCKPE